MDKIDAIVSMLEQERDMDKEFEQDAAQEAMRAILDRDYCTAVEHCLKAYGNQSSALAVGSALSRIDRVD